MKTRLFTSLEAKILLGELEAKTNLTPNILCRYGIAISLKDDSPLDFKHDSGGQEFHRSILTGDYDTIFRELIKQKESKMINDDDYFTKYLKAHLERGVRLLHKEIQLCGSFTNFINEFYNPDRGGAI